MSARLKLRTSVLFGTDAFQLTTAWCTRPPQCSLRLGPRYGKSKKAGTHERGMGAAMFPCSPPLVAFRIRTIKCAGVVFLLSHKTCAATRCPPPPHPLFSLDFAINCVIKIIISRLQIYKFYNKYLYAVSKKTDSKDFKLWHGVTKKIQKNTLNLQKENIFILWLFTSSAYMLYHTTSYWRIINNHNYDHHKLYTIWCISNIFWSPFSF